MHVPVIAVLVMAALLPEGSWALPGGAPSSACATIAPIFHAGSSQDLNRSPYTLNISALSGGYVPGNTYMLTLSGTTFFRGLLVQARSMADDTPVGSFTAVPGTRLSSCTRADSAITHSTRSDKRSIQLPFTAPVAGTGPFRFLYAVVQRNDAQGSIFYATAETSATAEQEETTEPPTTPPPPLVISFTGDTPAVTGNDVLVQLSVSRPVSLLCQMITNAGPRMPMVIAEQDCSSGQTTFENVRSGRHRVRVIADDNEAVIRSRIIIMPDSPGFCSLNAINNGVTTIFDSNGNVTSYRIEFRPIGMDVGFICIINRIEDEVSCSSPFEIMAREGLESVKVVPNPKRCPGPRRPVVFKLTE